MFLVETSGNTTRKAELKWVFKNATSDWPNKKPGEKITSPYFHAENEEDVKWCITLFPNGNKEENLGHLAVYLSLTKTPTNRSALATKFSFTLLAEEEGRILPSRPINRAAFTFILGEHPSRGCPQFAKLSDVLKRKVFSLTCKLEYEDSRTTTTTSILSGPSMQSTDEEANSSLNQDLEQFFTSQSETDVFFIVDGKEIKAHKAILSARSPVFAAMLKNEMKEATTNRVEINDITPDIFEALLRFIYTDHVDLTKIDTKNLLAAANKYLLPLLKFQCQHFLSQSISVENCVELLALADLHNAVYLKKSAMNFIRLHRAEIIQSEGWKNLKECRPDLSYVFDVVESLF